MTTPGLIGGRDHFNEFDLDAPEFAEHYDEVIDELLDKCPVAHSKESGGYWVVSRAEDFKRVALDHETFTSTRGFEPARGNEGEGGVKLYPLQIDPPYQTRWRAALGPFFSARVVGELEGSIREHADYLVDSFIGDGSCDFVDTFAAQPPGRVFFGSFLKVAFSELPAIQKATDDAIRGPAEGRAAAWQSVGGFLMESMKMRADEPPRGDFVDVVMKHPEDAARLASEPELRANFVEEVIRVYAPVFALGRTATKDTEIAGQKIAEGDMVMLAEGAACRDPRVVDNPTKVDLDRRVPINLAFSYGPHRCVGAH